jgi:hypothetical protein
MTGAVPLVVGATFEVTGAAAVLLLELVPVAPLHPKASPSTVMAPRIVVGRILMAFLLPWKRRYVAVG